MWMALQKEKLMQDFSSKKVLLSTKPRKHISLSTIVNKNIELEMSKAAFLRYNKLAAVRYLIAKNITFDLLFTLYNVNSFELLAFRISKMLNNADIALIKKSIKNMKRPNLEMRVIGMQNGNAELFSSIEKVRNITNAEIIEIDLFGDEIRNIAIDLKNGSSYDLLLLNRLYRPGELINNTKFEDAMKDSKQLSLV